MSRSGSPEKRQHWLDRMQRYAASGLTVAAFCVSESVSIPSFYQWRRKLVPAVESDQGSVRDPKYLLLLDHTAHVLRQGKASLAADVAPIFERLGTTAETWKKRLTQLKTTLDCRKFSGRFLASTHEVLSAAAQKLGLHHLVNLAGRAHLSAPITPAPSG